MKKNNPYYPFLFIFFYFVDTICLQNLKKSILINLQLFPLSTPSVLLHLLKDKWADLPEVILGSMTLK